MDIIQQIRETFPQMAWLLNDPEVGPLLKEAVNPSGGFSPATFEAKVKNTNWYKKRTASQRDWEILWNTDRKTAYQRLGEFKENLKRHATRLGVNATNAQLDWITSVGVGYGWDPMGAEVAQRLSQLFSSRPGNGAINTAKHRAITISEGDYLLPLSRKSAEHWGMLIATGQRTEEDLRKVLMNKARSKFPFLNQQILQGQTPGQIFAPHKDIIASTLEISPGEVDLLHGKWNQVLSKFDKGAKQARPLTLYETEVLAKSDPKYWTTKNGKQAEADTASSLLRLFGKRA